MIKPPNYNTKLVEFFRQLSESMPFLQGKELIVESAATFTTQKFAHGLGRPYRGGWVLRSSDISVPVVLAPDTQTDAAVNLSFVDVAGAASTLAFWVY